MPIPLCIELAIRHFEDDNRHVSHILLGSSKIGSVF